jgi:hypothetical protein
MITPAGPPDKENQFSRTVRTGVCSRLAHRGLLVGHRPFWLMAGQSAMVIEGLRKGYEGA